MGPAHLRALALLDDTALTAIAAFAEAAYPEEACGFVTDQGVRPCRNVHARPREGFRLSAPDLLFLARSADGPSPVRVLWHSHPDGHARPSAADLRAAAPAGEPLHPGLVHLVVACRGGRSEAAAAHVVAAGPSVDLVRSLARLAARIEARDVDASFGCFLQRGQ